MGLRLAASRAELLQLKTIRIIPAVLARDVVAILALLASERNFWSYVGGGHVLPLSCRWCSVTRCFSLRSF